MSITQERIRDLLEEYENLINAVQACLRRAGDLIGRETLTAADKADMLWNELCTLKAIPRYHAMVERRDLNRNWKRNQRQADKARQKRRERGIPERSRNATDTDWLPRGLGVSEQFIEDDGYDAFNADPRFAPTNPASATRPSDADDNRKPSQLTPEQEVYLCMHEMGLAEKPTADQLTFWKEMKAKGH
jgi:hypothetical protein